VSAIVIACIVFVCCFGAALVGLSIKLPDRHLDGDSKETIRLVMGLIATMSALVLGLLIASANSSYDTQAAELQQMSANLMQFDRMLVLYGPEAQEARNLLRQTVTTAHQRVWPAADAKPARLDPSLGRGQVDALFTKLQTLASKSAAQTRAQDAAWQLAGSLTQVRMLMYQQLGGSASWSLLAVLIFWVSVLFLGFGLFARFHVTLVVTLLVGAISVAGAIFLILELNQPYTGLIRLSDAPIRSALASMER
jgi:Protein of unknown function (DUF4239)